MEKRLDDVLSHHHHTIQSHLGEGHFLSLQEEIEFMGRSQGDCQNRLLEITTEILRLQGMPKTHLAIFMHKIRTAPRAGIAEEFQKLPLQETLNLLSSLQLEYEKVDLNRQKYEENISKISLPDTDLASLGSLFEEPSLASLFANVQTLHLKLLEEEYDLTQEKLRQLSERATQFAEKWLAEKKIELNTDLYLSIVQSIAKVIEGKNIAYHTESIDATPFLNAAPPVLPNPPRLRFSFLIGCGIGAAFSILFLLLKQLYQGASASSENLKALGYSVVGNISKNSLADSSTLRALALSLSQKRMGSCVILCTSQTEIGFLEPLIQLLSIRNERILWITMESSAETGLFSILENRRERLPIQQKEKYDLLSAGLFSPNYEILLTSSAFQKLLDELKNSYDWIFIQKRMHLSAPLLPILASYVDSVIFQISTEKLDDLISLPQHTLFLVQNPLTTPPSPFTPYLPLRQLSPLIEKLKKNFNKSYFSENKEGNKVHDEGS